MASRISCNPSPRATRWESGKCTSTSAEAPSGPPIDTGVYARFQPVLAVELDGDGRGDVLVPDTITGVNTNLLALSLSTAGVIKQRTTAGIRWETTLDPASDDDLNLVLQISTATGSPMPSTRPAHRQTLPSRRSGGTAAMATSRWNRCPWGFRLPTRTARYGRRT